VSKRLPLSLTAGILSALRREQVCVGGAHRRHAGSVHAGMTELCSSRADRSRHSFADETLVRHLAVDDRVGDGVDPREPVPKLVAQVIASRERTWCRVAEPCLVIVQPNQNLQG
jgi:hypothetical protein